jgi:hypothetical protein
MSIASASLQEDYWDSFEIENSDIEFLYNQLIEIEKPQAIDELASALINERINRTKEELERRKQKEGKIYFPKDHYEVGETILLPQFNWEKALVKSVREGFNPDLPQFEVMEVELENGESKKFAAALAEHVLNEPLELEADNPLLNPEYVLQEFGGKIKTRLEEELLSNEDFVRIADYWFAKALLVDINIGYLNLAEALLDMEGGGPLATAAILKQIDVPTDVNKELTEFSLNYALQEDPRFDEVGTTGEVMWYLYKQEPEWVREKPIYLQYTPLPQNPEYIQELGNMLSSDLVDELEDTTPINGLVDEATVDLIYPHWRSGSLPLSMRYDHIFPTAIESPRVLFTFVDGNNGQKFTGWVVRHEHYVGGLTDWYQQQGVIPGSIIHLRKGDQPGEVTIWVDKLSSSREWLRTALVGSDGAVVFAMLKQLISTSVDERIVIYIPETEVLDDVWKGRKRSLRELEKITISMMRELVKLNPQGHVHFEELYSAVNLLMRCPPGPIMSLLMEKEWATHLGDLYFNFNRESLEE